MAEISFDGMDEIQAIMQKLSNIPDEVIDDALTAMAETAMKYQKSTGESMGVYDPEWNGVHVLQSFAISKLKENKDGSKSKYITFKGKRKRGNQQTRNAEIAFVNEFGCNRKNIPARPFVGTAIQNHLEEIYRSGEKVYDEWLDKNNI